MIPPTLSLGWRVTFPCTVSRRYVVSRAQEVSSERCLSPHQVLGLDRAGHAHPVRAPDNAWSFPGTCVPSSAGRFARQNLAEACWWHTWTGRSSDRILRDRDRRAQRSVCSVAGNSVHDCPSVTERRTDCQSIRDGVPATRPVLRCAFAGKSTELGLVPFC